MSSKERANLAMQGELRRIDTEIEQITLALAQTPDDDPSMPLLLNQLGNYHNERFDVFGQTNDINKATEYAIATLTLTAKDDPLWLELVANLGCWHRKRYECLGDPQDNDRAMEYTSLALAMAPDRSPESARMLGNLGVFHSGRFENLGEVSDLEKAIEYQSRAVTLTPDGHPHLLSRLGYLAVSLSHRFKRLGEVGDLEKAIEYHSRAATLTPDGHPEFPNRLANLAMFLKNRYERLGKVGDLEKAIEYQSQAVKSTPDGHPHLSSLLGNLAGSLNHRFQSLGIVGDIENALQYQYQALALTPDDHTHLPTLLHNLAISHLRRFGNLGDHHDLVKAIEYVVCALGITPHGHPTTSHKHFILAECRLSHYHNVGNESDLQDSLASFRLASQFFAGSPRDRFKHATAWAHKASLVTSLGPIEAYQTAMSLLPQFIWLGTTISQRYEDLSITRSLAVDAAHAAILTSDYTLALEWLEHARCVVWNQSVTLRSPLDQLHSVHPELVTSLQNMTHQLHSASSESRESRALSYSMTLDQVAREHHRLAWKYENLIAQVRTLPGFEDFLRPMKANALFCAARYGPIIIINCHEDRCDALAIIPGGNRVEHIALPNLTGKNVQATRLQMEQSVRNSRQIERTVKRGPVLEDRVEFGSVLAFLWYDVVKPVLDHLGYMDDAPGDNLPHVTWCPTGALSFLPLHAAGDYTQPKSKVFNYVISSYTPTISAILSTSPSLLTPDTKVLAVGQANTPGHNPLPGTTDELAYLKTHTSGRAGYSQLTESQATNTAVLDAMEQHDWVHLACHAHQCIEDPTKSGFFLHDKDPLDLAAINRRLFKNKGLAYLSACQTATGDKSLPDEAIHLASGMLMVGYSSVIGTMWSVMDDDAPFVANRVYGELMREGKLGNGEAGRALHYVVAALRERVGETSFKHWVPYIHIAHRFSGEVSTVEGGRVKTSIP